SIAAAITILAAGALNAAPEKGAERLAGNRILSAAPITAAPMNCPACKTTVASIPDRDAKGGAALAGSSTRAIARHHCGECKTEITTSGVGRNAVRSVKHLCTRCS
ncbi:MAG: hypothetical protein ACK4UN_13115, partial [Limisphaerales bacterium]